MSTGIASLVKTRFSVALVLAAALLCGPVAHADPAQDQQFLDLLHAEQIDAIENIPALIARAHEICGELDAGTPFQSVMDEETSTAYSDNPVLHLMPGRVERTAVRFITASVDAYCPRHRGVLPA